METGFKPRWRNAKKKVFEKPAKRFKNLVAAKPIVYDDGMAYGDYSTGGVMSGYDSLATKYYEDPVLKPVIIKAAPVYTAPAEEMSSEEYQAYMAQINTIAALQNPNVSYTPTDLTYAQPSAPSVLDNPPPQIQFIGIDEFTAISNEGINIPADANVVIVPVSEIHEPDIFQEIVEQQLAQPEKPIYDIVVETIAPLSYTDTKDDNLKQEILFNQAVVEVKQEFPALTINEAAIIVSDTKPIPSSNTNPIVTSIENEANTTKPVVNKPLEIITNAIDKLIDKTTTSIDSGLIADDVRENMAKDTNGMYIAGSVVVIGILALLFKK